MVVAASSSCDGSALVTWLRWCDVLVTVLAILSVAFSSSLGIHQCCQVNQHRKMSGCDPVDLSSLPPPPAPPPSPCRCAEGKGGRLQSSDRRMGRAFIYFLFKDCTLLKDRAEEGGVYISNLGSPMLLS